ncbi:MAG: bifunctional lysylphosphatidylglycerol flippase/synthetase MprF [Azospirillaceae bacterium]|nr:bifunctional lysylphosphatidylglycerol flippase/synthetase MprF [Azospirillaceae bacterium]
MGLLVLVLAAWALHYMLKEFRYREVVDHLQTLPVSAFVKALTLMMLSYWTLTGYDVSALHYIGVKLPYRTVALASFAGYAIGNNVGFMMLSGGSVRYRIYSAAGVGASDVARVIAFCGLMFTVGITAVGAAGLLVGADTMAPMLRLPPRAVEAIAALLILALLAAIAVAGLVRRPLRLWRWTLILPSPTFLLVQIAIASLDILLSGGVLWVLLPGDPSLSYGGFLAVYSAALVSGLLSHLPGGLGVFDSIIIVGLSPHLPVSAVLGALVAFRAIYYLVPLVAAGLLLAANELKSQRHLATLALRLVGGWVSIMVPWAMAAMTFIGGVIILIDGAVPSTPWRMAEIRAVVPGPVVELSHLVASLIGAALLLLARGLYRRLESAHTATTLLMAIGILATLLKGLDYEAAALLAVMLAVLAPCRPEFRRPAALTDLNFSPGWMAAILAAVVASLWLALFAFQHVSYAADLWWQFGPDADAGRSLRAAATVVVAVLYATARPLLRPRAVQPPLPDLDDLAHIRHVLPTTTRPDAAVALAGDKCLLFNDARTAFVMYAVRGRTWLALGDPVGPEAEQAELIWRFRELCDRRGSRPAYLEVSAAVLPLYLDVGMTLLKMGDEARIPLGDFSLDHPDRADLRARVEQCRALGYRAAIVPQSLVGTLIPQLLDLASTWRQITGHRDKAFTAGPPVAAYLTEFDLAVIYQDQRVVGFANLLNGQLGGIDLVRVLPGAPAGLLDLLVVTGIDWARNRGCPVFSLGLTPPADFESNHFAMLWQRFDLAFFTLGEHFGAMPALRHYKARFAPLWEPRYLACPGGLVPGQVLADATMLVKEGPRGFTAR